MKSTISQLVFRVDASKVIGSGHVLRCLTLAESLRLKGVRASFICRREDGDLCELITRHNFEVFSIESIPEQTTYAPVFSSAAQQQDAHNSILALDALSEKPDWIVVDHYKLDFVWEKEILPYCKKLMVIDDLANRRHSAALLLDQGYGAEFARYQNLTGGSARLLLGPRYALLRPEFSEIRKSQKLKSFTETPLHLHVFFGMYDQHSLSLRTAKWVLNYFPEISLRLVIRGDRNEAKAFEELSAAYPERLEWRTISKNVADFMSSCQIALGAPGMSAWERACLGLAPIYIATSSNQIPILQRLQAENLCRYMGEASTVSESGFREVMRDFLADRELCETLRMRGMEVSDGEGVPRVTEVMEEVL